MCADVPRRLGAAIFNLVPRAERGGASRQAAAGQRARAPPLFTGSSLSPTSCVSLQPPARGNVSADDSDEHPDGDAAGRELER